MSGHNKWSKIKHKKAAGDAKKSQTFSKLARLITSESKKAHGDVTLPGLATAIAKAKTANMPADNIDRAVKKGAGGEADSMEAILYEAYGPGGVALMIEALTDNRNKAAQEVKHILSKNGCALAAPGSAAWAFEKTADGWEPKSTTDLVDTDAEKLASLVDELEENDEVQAVFTNAQTHS